MTTKLSFATYSALTQAGKQASEEMKQLERYLQSTSTHSHKGRTTAGQAGHSKSTQKKHEKAAA